MTDKKTDEDEEIDLFGNPIVPLRDRRGRKSFKKDKENQDFVAVRAAMGWSQAAIASEIGCDEKTLRKYFSRELAGGRLIVEGMCLDVLMKKVREGHAPSVKQLRDALTSTAPPAPRSRRQSEDEDHATSKALGKKEQRVLDAQQVPEDWGDIKAKRQRH